MFISIFIFLNSFTYSQNISEKNSSNQVSILFDNQNILPLKLSYSNKEIKRKTNDSTYIKTTILYGTDGDIWNELNVEIRRRGNFRLKKCYYAPLKLKIKKSASKGTLFEGNKKLKLVLPCLTNSSNNDYILKEYMAYKLYEIISSYYFSTRLLDITYLEINGKKTKSHSLKGILIEDDKKVAKRLGGNLIKRNTHPLNQDPITSVQNCFFQFMIGCTDFSTAFQHNQKLLYVNNIIVPIPYDFDMSGLVSPIYAVFSGEEDENLGLSSVEERLYRGFKRNPSIIKQVRNEFLTNESRIIEIVDSFEPDFDNQKEFSKARKYIIDFFKVMQNDILFKKEIINKLRSK